MFSFDSDFVVTLNMHFCNYFSAITSNAGIVLTGEELIYSAILEIIQSGEQ